MENVGSWNSDNTGSGSFKHSKSLKIIEITFTISTEPIK